MEPSKPRLAEPPQSRSPTKKEASPKPNQVLAFSFSVTLLLLFYNVRYTGKPAKHVQKETNKKNAQKKIRDQK